ncbi:hypothetical protein NKH18_00640 [Streptomyces sp. M10(2022)]
MTVAVAPEARAAQRRIIGTINTSGRLNADGLALWREVACGEWKATAADLSSDLDMLQVPHTVVTAFRFPLASSYSKAMREGEEVRILRENLGHLLPWMPSLEQVIADIPKDAPHWDFTVFQPGPTAWPSPSCDCRRSGPPGRRSRPAPPGWSAPSATTTCATRPRTGLRSTSGCPSSPSAGGWCAGSAATTAWTRWSD